MCLIVHIHIILPLIVTWIESWCCCMWMFVWCVWRWGCLRLCIATSYIAARCLASILIFIVFAATWWVTIAFTVIFIDVQSMLFSPADIYSLQSIWCLLIVIWSSLIFSCWHPLISVYHLVILVIRHLWLILVLEESSNIIIWGVVW